MLVLLMQQLVVASPVSCHGMGGMFGWKMPAPSYLFYLSLFIFIFCFARSRGGGTHCRCFSRARSAAERMASAIMRKHAQYVQRYGRSRGGMRADQAEVAAGTAAGASGGGGGALEGEGGEGGNAPYVVPATGAVCPPDLAQSMVERYCRSLPGNDQ